MGRKVVCIGRKVGLGAGRLDIIFSTDEENIYCRREKPMTEIVHVRAEPLPNCTGLADTPAVCMGVAEMLYVCTGVAETPPNWTGVVGTPPLS